MHAIALFLPINTPLFRISILLVQGRTAQFFFPVEEYKHAELIQVQLSICFETYHVPPEGCGTRPRLPGTTLNPRCSDSHVQFSVCPWWPESTHALIKKTLAFFRTQQTCACVIVFATVMKGLRRSLKGLFQPLVLEASVHGRLVPQLLGYDEVKHDPGRSLWWGVIDLRAAKKGVGEENKGKKGRKGRREE